MSIPERIEVAIVGGGVIGCSIAYHLAKIGITDVALFERKQLTCGTTWHAAGLIGQLRATRRMTELAQYTAELLFELERETGQSTGFKQNGSVTLATDPARFEELRRNASMAKTFGLEVEVIGVEAIRSLYPIIETEDVLGGLWIPKDGQANPVDVTQAFAKGARARGAQLFENAKIARILRDRSRVLGVELASGERILADTVVLAAGMWSREIAASIGVAAPLHAAEHFYIVSEPIEALPSDLPVLRSYDECAYFKEDAGKILLGAFEPIAKPWGMDGIPEEFCFDALPEDLEHFEPILEKAIERMPLLADAGVQTFFNGPESFTPDDRYLLGEAPELKNLYLACGFNSIGIQSSGGAGKALAEWIRDRLPPVELADVDIRRMHPFQANRAYLRDRTTETLGLLYAKHWPHRQFETARGVRRSPFHDRLIAAGACMGEQSGWERPNWFAEPGSKPKYQYDWSWQNWHERAGVECRALRDRVALFDQSSFAKHRLDGKDALAVLEAVSANRIDVEPGRVVYTQWLNQRGGIEADVTVARLDERSFLIVSPAASQIRDRAWLSRWMGEARAHLTDLTSGLPMLGLMGPSSRALLSRVSPDDFSNEAFPFGATREIEIGYAKARATRLTYVGELGFELYVEAEFATHVFDTLVEAGAEFGLTHAGYHAMNAARLEKGYRHWGHDIGEEDTPLEAGLGFAIAWDKTSFNGRTALMRSRDRGKPTRRLVQLKLADPKRLLHHEEPIWRDGQLVGSATSGAYGHRIEASIGMGYVRCAEGVDRAWLEAGSFEVEVAGERVPAKVQFAPWYDPRNAKIRC